MIRMIFYPELEMTADKLSRLVVKLAPLSCRVLIEPRGRSFLFIETSQIAGNMAYAIQAKNYTFCDGCNTLHFMAEHHAKDTFRCMCGKTLNVQR